MSVLDIDWILFVYANSMGVAIASFVFFYNYNILTKEVLLHMAIVAFVFSVFSIAYKTYLDVIA